MEILEITPNIAVLVPIVVILVGLVRMGVKKVKRLKKHEDVIAVASAFVFSFFLAYENQIPDTFTITQAIGLALMSMGLFSGTKTVAKKI